MKVRGERDQGKGGDRKSQSQPTTVKLQDIGVTKTQSSRWQQLASLSKEEQEERISVALMYVRGGGGGGRRQAKLDNAQPGAGTLTQGHAAGNRKVGSKSRVCVRFRTRLT
jgi:hypothetical protein